MRKAIRGFTPSSSGCHHLLEGVPYCSSLLSSSRLKEVVAVVLFLQGLAHWMELFFDSADDTTHLVVFFPHEQFDIRVARARNWTTFFGREQTPPVSRGTAQGFQEDWIRSPCLSRRKPPCLRRVLPIFYPTGPMARRSVVILMGTH